MENIPSLAGQPEFFVLNQLFLMREGVRQVEAMAPFVKDLKDDDIDALAEHFAKLDAEAERRADRSGAGQARRGARRRSALRLLPSADLAGQAADAAARQAARRLPDPCR